ncbi:glutathione S-transferase N-terminal domain-containing protein [Novosphingobium sp. FKTRR1]|uniref:glutathione S-transferase N-terminal domain-containing protein n=1 Tax=Novosphingobium sp. FKTRR1 TaxID=2879118 RepID=UPI001CF098FC|nr:glutathione S-transferase N-terminal domain-containing protein [Novosphingobium sp. FKTRR1]
MIELYTAPTPNGWKISIMLEECGLPYRTHWVDIGKGEQFAPEFLAISPNNRIPAIVDSDPVDGGVPVSVFETGAILLYLADKTGQFIPADLRGRTLVLEWLAWQIAGLGPMLGQHGHFALYAPERLPYPTERYRHETLRLYGVLDRRLTGREYIAAEEYTIADIACWPWVRTWKAQGVPLADFPAVQAWYDRLKLRDGLRRGVALGADRVRRRPQDDAEAARTLFGFHKDQA